MAPVAAPSSSPASDPAAPAPGRGRSALPAADNEQLFVALRHLGREVEYILYPESWPHLRDHGPDRPRIDRNERMLAWFDEHLAGSPASAGRRRGAPGTAGAPRRAPSREDISEGELRPARAHLAAAARWPATRPPQDDGRGRAAGGHPRGENPASKAVARPGLSGRDEARVANSSRTRAHRPARTADQTASRRPRGLTNRQARSPAAARIGLAEKRGGPPPGS